MGGFVCHVLECASTTSGILCCIVTVNACAASSTQVASMANHDPIISESVIAIDPVSSMGPNHICMIDQKPPPYISAMTADAHEVSSTLKPMTSRKRLSMTTCVEVGVESVISNPGSCSLPYRKATPVAAEIVVNRA